MPWYKHAKEVDETAFDHLDAALERAPEDFKFLTGIRCGILFRETNPRQKGEECAATIKTTSAVERCLSGYDVLVVVGLPAWMRYDDHQRTALMDHELRHLCETENGGLATQGHDLEVFTENVRLYGQWNMVLEKQLPQLTLAFAEALPVEEDTGTG